jgi:hypothetical protein
MIQKKTTPAAAPNDAGNDLLGAVRDVGSQVFGKMRAQPRQGDDSRHGQ